MISLAAVRMVVRKAQREYFPSPNPSRKGRGDPHSSFGVCSPVNEVETRPIRSFHPKPGMRESVKGGE
jgi:hypothetical protein